MPALTARDANAWPLMDMFDFDAPPFMTPPTDLADAVIDEAGVARCEELFPSGGGL
jgi:phospholipase C